MFVNWLPTLLLIDTLQKVNTTMKQFYVKTQQWKEDMQKSDEQNRQQMKHYQEEVAAVSLFSFSRFCAVHLKNLLNDKLSIKEQI